MVSAPSFYFALGSKESLFKKIVDSYHLRLVRLVEASLKRNSVVEIVKELLSDYAKIFAECGDKNGASNQAYANCTNGGAVATQTLRHNHWV